VLIFFIARYFFWQTQVTFQQAAVYTRATMVLLLCKNEKVENFKTFSK
jgi:hypothetical protein